MAQKYKFHEPNDAKYTTNENTNAQQSSYKNIYAVHQNFAHCVEWQKLCLHNMLSQLYIDEITTYVFHTSHFWHHSTGICSLIKQNN